MFEVSVKSRFSAAHHLTGYAGNCAAPHGHNWDVELFVAGETLDGMGILVDFRRIKDALKDVLADLDHKDLNVVAEFRDRSPTSEHLAQLIFRRVAERLKCQGCRVSRVTVGETPESRASYWET
jgi:6-pyruvoyltetrahydropterin/6-carboxytetrahydropterin synthase